MKTIILGLIGLGLCVQASADSLFTMDGVAYKNITLLRVDPDGLYIEYMPPNGGLGMSKVKFTRLTPEHQKQFGYDPAKAKDYEAKVAKANEDARQEGIRWDQAAKAFQAAEQVRQDQADRNETDRLMAMAQLSQAQANSGHSGSDNSSYSESSSWGGGGGGFGTGFGGGFGSGFGSGGFGSPFFSGGFGSSFFRNGFFGLNGGFGQFFPSLAGTRFTRLGIAEAPFVRNSNQSFPISVKAAHINSRAVK
jgi:hypothetical protein